MTDDSRTQADASTTAGKSPIQLVSEVLLTGIAIIVPLVITIYVLQVTFRLVADLVQPLIDLLEATGVIGFLEQNGLITLLVRLGLYTDVYAFIGEIVAVAALLSIIVLVGLLASHPWSEWLVGYADFFIAAIPGFGTVYRSFRRMGDIILDDQIENFQEVKLVEAVGPDQYMIGFKVGDSPGNVRSALEAEAVATMFLPLAPNPVTGGLLTYVPEDRLYDVDMTVDEAVRNIITSGIAGHESEGQGPVARPVTLSAADVPWFRGEDDR